MKLASWLTGRECAHRWPLMLAELAVVATAMSLAVGLELVSRGREAAVAAQIDQMGAAFQLLPQGTSAVARQRFEQLDLLLPAGTRQRASARLSSFARAVEPRLVVLAPSGSGSVPVVGVIPGASVAGLGADLGARELAVGEAFAQQHHLRVSSTLPLYGEPYRVRQILPSRGDEEDLLAFVPLASLQESSGLPGAVNELRLFARVGSRQALEQAARRAFPDANLIVADRGEVAEIEIPSSLEGFRTAVLALLAAAAALGLLAAGRLSASERSKELAILSALGADARTLFSALLARSCLVGLAGGLVGILVGATVAFGQDASSTLALPGLGRPLLTALGAAVALSALTAVPTALAAARLDPFRLLADP